MSDTLTNIHDLVGRCPFATSQKVLAGKWALLILHELAKGPVRFRELERRLNPVTQATLTRHSDKWNMTVLSPAKSMPQSRRR